MTKLLLAAILSLTWTGVALAEDSVLRLPTTETRMARPLTDDALLPRRGCGPQADGERPTADGNAHGDVVVGVGTNGYRDVGARLCAPLGPDGEVQVMIRRTEGDAWRGYRSGEGRPGSRHD